MARLDCARGIGERTGARRVKMIVYRPRATAANMAAQGAGASLL